jgi:small GTP-binding protein
MIAAQPPRVVLIGDAAVGKTALAHRICEDRWIPDTVATVSTACFFLKRNAGTDSEVTIQVWDTAGAERYSALNSVYYHNAAGCILVFDLASRPSFESLDSWIAEFAGLAQPHSVILIVGNKADLLADHPDAQAQRDVAEDWARRHGLPYVTASARDGTGIADLMGLLFDRIPAAQATYAPTSTLRLAPARADGEKRCC